MNIIVIVADSLRVDHVGCYGSSVKTPNIDRLAADSAVFEQAYGENLPTLPCRTAWWTGRYLFTRRGWQPFEPTDYLLAEVLWDRGITSALITDTYHMHKPVYNCGRGFDTVVWIRGQEYDPWIVDERIAVDPGKYHRLRGDDGDQLWRERFVQYLRNVSWYKNEEDYCVARVVNASIKWLEEMTKTQKDNLLLWVDCFDPHEPWDPPSPYREMYDPDYQGQELIDPVPGPIEGYMTEEEVRHTLALYAGEVTFVDKWVGLLIDRVRELGLYDNTLIMFTSDHGEPFGEHAIIRKAGPNGYEELAHIPWIIHYPDGLGKGKRFSCFVQPPDMMPTILDVLGISADLATPYAAPKGLLLPQDIITKRAKASMTGRSLIPILTGERESIRDFAVTAHHARQWVLRTEKWSFFLNFDGRPPELYNRQADPAEQRNVITKNRDVADELELRLRRFADEVS